MQNPHQSLDYSPNLPPEQVFAELDFAITVTSLGKRKLARYLADLDARRMYLLTGHGDTIHYAMDRLGMQRRTALDYTTTGRRLESLPKIDAALFSGEISWSKARILARVAVLETESEWLTYADERNCDKLSTDAKRCVLGDSPPSNEGGLPEITITMRAEMSMINHELWDAAKRKLSDEMQANLTNGDMCSHLCRLVLKTDVDGKIQGRTKVAHAAYQIVVHQDETGSHVQTSHGEVSLKPELATQLAADAEVLRPAKPLANNTDPERIPEKTRLFALARDGYRCTNCSGVHGLQVHHIKFLSLGGGHAASNLTTLCARCHSMTHASLLDVTRVSARQVVFSNQRGHAEQREKSKALARGCARLALPTSNQATSSQAPRDPLSVLHTPRVDTSRGQSSHRSHPSPQTPS